MAGRFTSVDPLMASASTVSPQTFNRYTYALNNPYKYVDPSGMAVDEETDQVFAAFSAMAAWAGDVRTAEDEAEREAQRKQRQQQTQQPAPRTVGLAARVANPADPTKAQSEQNAFENRARQGASSPNDVRQFGTGQQIIGELQNLSDSGAINTVNIGRARAKRGIMTHSSQNRLS